MRRAGHFNSRAHVERDAKVTAGKAYYQEFQLTRSRGARHADGRGGRKSNQFQLTRSRGARPNDMCLQLRMELFQLTRSRGARRPTSDRGGAVAQFQLTRSRGARPCRPNARSISPNGISTHALTWSATPCTSPKRRCIQHFNSRAHVERDELDALVALKIPHFNSRAHVERDFQRRQEK